MVLSTLDEVIKLFKINIQKFVKRRRQRIHTISRKNFRKMLQFEDCDDQDLGNDFVFESDPNSLARILDNRELSPRSVLAMRMSAKLIQPTISPAKGAPRHVRNNPDKFDFFESKHGDIFWRPKTLGSGMKAQPIQQKPGKTTTTSVEISG